MGNLEKLLNLRKEASSLKMLRGEQDFLAHLKKNINNVLNHLL